MSTEVRVPTLGESVTEATIATWFKKPGDAVAVDEMLCELETDKVTVEVPSPVAGTMGDIIAAEGDTVGVDALLATINEGAASSDARKAWQEGNERYQFEARKAEIDDRLNNINWRSGACTGSGPDRAQSGLAAQAPVGQTLYTHQLIAVH